MLYEEILARLKVEEALREADKNRLIEIANRSLKANRRNWFAKLIHLFGLNEL